MGVSLPQVYLYYLSYSNKSARFELGVDTTRRFPYHISVVYIDELTVTPIRIHTNKCAQSHAADLPCTLIPAEHLNDLGKLALATVSLPPRVELVRTYSTSAAFRISDTETLTLPDRDETLSLSKRSAASPTRSAGR